MLATGCRCKFLTFDFILSNIDSRRWLDQVGGKIINHLGLFCVFFLMFCNLGVCSTPYIGRVCGG